MLIPVEYVWGKLIQIVFKKSIRRRYALLAVALDQQKHTMRQFCDYKHTRKFTDYEDKRLVVINSLANVGQCYEIRYQ